MIGLALNEAAYMAEIVRAGLLSVDTGPGGGGDRARHGLVPDDARMVMPQAMRVIIPPTGNEVISMLKTTSLVAAIPALHRAVRSSPATSRRTSPRSRCSSSRPLVPAFTSMLMVGQYFLEKRLRGAASATAAPTAARRPPEPCRSSGATSPPSSPGPLPCRARMPATRRSTRDGNPLMSDTLSGGATSAAPATPAAPMVVAEAGEVSHSRLPARRRPLELLWPGDAPATTGPYLAFLEQFLPGLHEFLLEQKLIDHSFFHISDEPRSEAIENYRQAHALLTKLAPWTRGKVLDALSDIRYGKEGLVDIPVPLLPSAEKYREAKIPHWVYF